MRLFTSVLEDGLQVANRSMYIAAALVFWFFTLAEDPGNPIDDTAFTSDIVSYQKPFSLRRVAGA
ncbi:hypothetical protein AZE42_04398 [Rhizopogon vesiculosus]|uniref:Uncharacterized protein n=1 Tax=Rhizopogon vesiculosus TaxID=180088 RepID=A0A1J8QIN9_9AGAM|nr:hypothetical protein AZE42_04398 [Rhizopogon vesiculosus]